MLLDYETLIGQIEPEGFTCLVALAIKSPQPTADLSSLLHLGARKVKEILDRCFRFGYVGPVAPLDFSKWHITSKGRELLHAFFQTLIGSGSDPLQLTLPGSNPVTDGGSNPAGTNLGYVARGAQQPLIHSDQIIDQESEMNEIQPPARNLQAVAAALERHHIKDLPGKPNRTILLQDDWVTSERIDAAILRALDNPLRKSPSPIGLAVAELLKHRGEIDEWIAEHPIQAEAVEPIESEEISDTIVPCDESISKYWSMAKDELSLEMTRATFNTWVSRSECIDYEKDTSTFVIAVPNAYTQEWLDLRLRSTVERVLTGINGNRQRVQFVIWKDWQAQHVHG